MCHHHRSNYGHGHGRGLGHRGYGYQHHRGGPLTALVALAVPLLTQRSTTEKQALTQDSYQNYEPYQAQTDTREYLAPQTTGRTAAPTSAPLPATTNEPRGPPPAYKDDEKTYLPPTTTTTAAANELERDMGSMYITDRLPSPAVDHTYHATTVGARDYQPVHRGQAINNAPQLPPAMVMPNTPREFITSSLLDPSSRWAARFQRKEEKARAKLARKAEKYSRRERRDMGRVY